MARLRQHLRGSRAREHAQSQTLNLCEAALRVQEEAVRDALGRPPLSPRPPARRSRIPRHREASA